VSGSPSQTGLLGYFSGVRLALKWHISCFVQRFLFLEPQRGWYFEFPVGVLGPGPKLMGMRLDYFVYTNRVQ
jgi:hypothetical protein